MKGSRHLPYHHRTSPRRGNHCVAKTTVFGNARKARPTPEIVGYARVSTRGQKHRLQIDALKAAGCTRIVKETGSGADWNRPLFRAMLNGLHPGDTLIVWRIDRWARDLLLLLQTTRELEQRGVSFRSLTEGCDTTTPTGRLAMQIFGAFAEYEYRVNHLRTAAGLVAARTRGKHGGRPPVLSGDDLMTAATMLATASASVSGVARQLGVAPSTLYRHLRG